MADYFGHWLRLGRITENCPYAFCVNWFRTDANGRFIWPGFGENMRVWKWIVERCQGRAGARESSIGWVPDYENMEWKGLESFTPEQFLAVMAIKHDEWELELAAHDELFETLKNRLPRELQLRRELVHLSLGA